MTAWATEVARPFQEDLPVPKSLCAFGAGPAGWLLNPSDPSVL